MKYVKIVLAVYVVVVTLFGCKIEDTISSDSEFGNFNLHQGAISRDFSNWMDIPNPLREEDIEWVCSDVIEVRTISPQHRIYIFSDDIDFTRGEEILEFYKLGIFKSLSRYEELVVTVYPNDNSIVVYLTEPNDWHDGYEPLLETIVDYFAEYLLSPSAKASESSTVGENVCVGVTKEIVGNVVTYRFDEFLVESDRFYVEDIPTSTWKNLTLVNIKGCKTTYTHNTLTITVIDELSFAWNKWLDGMIQSYVANHYNPVPPAPPTE